MTTAFQSDAFQTTGFQIDAATGVNTGTLNKQIGAFASSASVTVTTASVVVEAPTGSTGGGGPAYLGKYRHDIRKAIRKALDDLSPKAPKRAREAAESVVRAFEIIPVVPVILPDLIEIEAIRVDLIRASDELAKSNKELDDISERRMVEAMRAKAEQFIEAMSVVEQLEEEEEAMAIFIALAA